MEKALIWSSGILGAYLVGSIPFGYLIGRLRGVDVRTVGSKNIGATNVYRTVGKAWGVLAFVCDFVKGLLPTLLAVLFVSSASSPIPHPSSFPVCVGLAAVVGHTLTVFMKFRGGKGVATGFGMMMALVPYPSLSAFAVFVVTVWLSHYISLGSMLAAVALAVLVWIFPATLTLRVIAALVAAFVIYKHKSNIQRLIAGCENKIY